MDFTLHPWQLYFLILAGWVNRQQQFVIEYLRTENQVLREKLGKKRILLRDDQRRRLAAKGKFLGRKMLEEVGTLFTPDTILRWPAHLNDPNFLPHTVVMARVFRCVDQIRTGKFGDL